MEALSYGRAVVSVFLQIWPYRVTRPGFRFPDLEIKQVPISWDIPPYTLLSLEVSEEHIASIFSLEGKYNQETA
jgi:hypothetical protein